MHRLRWTSDVVIRDRYLQNLVFLMTTRPDLSLAFCSTRRHDLPFSFRGTDCSTLSECGRCCAEIAWFDAKLATRVAANRIRANFIWMYSFMEIAGAGRMVKTVAHPRHVTRMKTCKRRSPRRSCDRLSFARASAAAASQEDIDVLRLDHDGAAPAIANMRAATSG